MAEAGKMVNVIDKERVIYLLSPNPFVLELCISNISYVYLLVQVSVLADDILKNVEFDALCIVYNTLNLMHCALSTTSSIRLSHFYQLWPLFSHQSLL
uniref:Uncharacterized protein n=1 Tax=Brassica oleracea TaxID=3712 RepID=A0A3P6C7N7_BRAOL|nr:unnamed protein product [Brassica oleracea]